MPVKPDLERLKAEGLVQRGQGEADLVREWNGVGGEVGYRYFGVVLALPCRV